MEVTFEVKDAKRTLLKRMETYEEFINNILDNRGRFGCDDEYHERHHILPKCLGGTNSEDNLIDLFAKEHYEAHRLLALENPNNDKLIYAWWCMSTMKSKFTNERYKISAEEYEEAKMAFALMHSEKCSKEGNPMYGVHRYKEENPFYGRHHTEEVKNKIKESSKRRWSKLEEREVLRKRAKERLSAPENNPMYGKHHTEEIKRKQRELKKGKYDGESNPRARKVIRLSDLTIYGYIGKAAEYNNMCRGTMCKRCKAHKDFMYYDEWLAEQNDLEGE